MHDFPFGFICGVIFTLVLLSIAIDKPANSVIIWCQNVVKEAGDE